MSTFISVYREVAGWIVAAQVTCLVAFLAWCFADEALWRRKQRQGEVGDDPGTVLREAFSDWEAEMDRLDGDGEGRG